MKKCVWMLAAGSAVLWATQSAMADDVGAQPLGSLVRSTAQVPGPNGATSPRAGDAPLRTTTSTTVRPSTVRDEPTQLPTKIGYRVYRQSFDPAHPAVSDVTVEVTVAGALAGDIVKAWDKFSAQASTQITAKLQQPNLFRQDYTLYNVRLNIPSVDTVNLLTRSPYPENRIDPVDASHPVIAVRSLSARLDAVSTTDFTDHNNDPSFHVTFDLTAYIHLGGGVKASSLTMYSAEVFISNVKYTPDNTGATAGAVYDFYSAFFGGTPYAQVIAQSLDGKEFNIGGFVKPVIDHVLDASRAQFLNDGSVIAGIFADAQYLNIVVAPHLVPNKSGQMGGTLTVTGLGRLASAGHGGRGNVPTQCANAFAVDVAVPVQPPYVASLNPTRLLDQMPQMQSISSQISYDFAAVEAGNDGYSCGYVINGLNSSAANTITFRTPAIAAGRPSMGWYTRVAFKECANSRSTAKAACEHEQGICSDPLVVPGSGSWPICTLVGTIEAIGSGGPGMMPSGTMASQATGPSAPVEKSPQTMPAWGSKAPLPAPETIPNWGAPAPLPGTAPVAGSAHNVNPQSQRSGQQTAVPSSLGSPQERQ
jgi:hypothetical protein